MTSTEPTSKCQIQLNIVKPCKVPVQEVAKLSMLSLPTFKYLKWKMFSSSKNAQVTRVPSGSRDRPHQSIPFAPAVLTDQIAPIAPNCTTPVIHTLPGDLAKRSLRFVNHTLPHPEFFMSATHVPSEQFLVFDLRIVLIGDGGSDGGGGYPSVTLFVRANSSTRKYDDGG
jgi:hypothetical protein